MSEEIYHASIFIVKKREFEYCFVCFDGCQFVGSFPVSTCSLKTRKITMGQNQSAEGKPFKSKDNIDELVDEVNGTSVKKHAKHELYISNTDLENGGDIDSLLQGIGYTPSESEGRSFFSPSFYLLFFSFRSF